jgi:NAD+ kinase
VIIDGRQAWDMKEDDLLEVAKAENPLRLLGSPQKGYFEILRNKLNWGGGDGPPVAR